jgi:hypothetical protein
VVTHPMNSALLIINSMVALLVWFLLFERTLKRWQLSLASLMVLVSLLAAALASALL